MQRSLACQRCQQTTNGPQAFLLICQGCNRSWHHRCHMPPIEDAELIQRIRATNAGDKANDLSAWTCRRCKKSKVGGVRAAPSADSSREHTVSTDSAVVSPRSSIVASSSSSSTPNPSSRTVVAPKVEIPHKQPPTGAVGIRRDDQVHDKKHGVAQQGPVQRTIAAKRTKKSVPMPAEQSQDQFLSASMRSEGSDVKMSDAPSTNSTGSPEGKKTAFETPSVSQRVSPLDQRQFLRAVPVNPPEDDDQMEVEILPPAVSRSASTSTPLVLDTVSLDNQILGANYVGRQPPMDATTSTREPEAKSTVQTTMTMTMTSTGPPWSVALFASSLHWPKSCVSNNVRWLRRGSGLL
ncbi:hypothetical protein PAXRUDRAFT_392007 [Paxillus rubicundulus Ve08.2h10]|uniref:PHD-type domain-containing protein n=1 Tax=Paxillus rubicundulus Ve08.2h10 TaxID=930991 RepID=A0A0D0DR55_9AGAM|nr:hypothetical protein PAXRUDRAFT_392007 [Paxillus rubicundulus Ve08.2h10]